MSQHIVNSMACTPACAVQGAHPKLALRTLDTATPRPDLHTVCVGCTARAGVHARGLTMCMPMCSAEGGFLPPGRKGSGAQLHGQHISSKTSKGGERSAGVYSSHGPSAPGGMRYSVCCPCSGLGCASSPCARAVPHYRPGSLAPHICLGPREVSLPRASLFACGGPLRLRCAPGTCLEPAEWWPECCRRGRSVPRRT
jgi:hypothetical protein